jgi:hypothetical protein
MLKARNTLHRPIRRVIPRAAPRPAPPTRAGSRLARSDPGRNVTSNVRAGFPVTLRPVCDHTVTTNRAAPTRVTLWPKRTPDHRDGDWRVGGRRSAVGGRRSAGRRAATQPETRNPGPTDAARSAAPTNARHPRRAVGDRFNNKPEPAALCNRLIARSVAHSTRRARGLGDSAGPESVSSVHLRQNRSPDIDAPDLGVGARGWVGGRVR